MCRREWAAERNRAEHDPRAGTVGGEKLQVTGRRTLLVRFE